MPDKRHRLADCVHENQLTPTISPDRMRMSALYSEFVSVRAQTQASVRECSNKLGSSEQFLRLAVCRHADNMTLVETLKQLLER